MIVLSAFVFSLVMVMLFYALWKFRAKPGDESDGEPIHGNTRLEVAWTLIPTIIVLFGAGYSWSVLNEIEEPAPNSLTIDVFSQQYAWSFGYPSKGDACVGEAHLLGRPGGDPQQLGAGHDDRERPGARHRHVEAVDVVQELHAARRVLGRRGGHRVDRHRALATLELVDGADAIVGDAGRCAPRGPPAPWRPGRCRGRRRARRRARR